MKCRFLTTVVSSALLVTPFTSSIFAQNPFHPQPLGTSSAMERSSGAIFPCRINVHLLSRDVQSVRLRSVETGLDVDLRPNADGDLSTGPIQPGQYTLSVVSHGSERDYNVYADGGPTSVSVDNSDRSGTAATVSARAMATPADVRRAIDRADKALQKNHLPRAENEIGKALAKSPRCAEALVIRGVLHLRQGKIADAQNDATMAVNADPSSAQAYFFLASLLQNTGNLQGAQRALEGGLRLSPNAWQGHFEMARLLFAQGRIMESLKHADTAATAAPHNFAAISLLRGLALFKLNRLRDAVPALRAFLSQAPSSPEAAQVGNLLNMITAGRNSTATSAGAR